MLSSKWEVHDDFSRSRSITFDISTGWHINEMAEKKEAQATNSLVDKSITCWFKFIRRINFNFHVRHAEASCEESLWKIDEEKHFGWRESITSYFIQAHDVSSLAAGNGVWRFVTFLGRHRSAMIQSRRSHEQLCVGFSRAFLEL